MSFTIAVAGKGGTGKTTLTAMTIRYLQKHHQRPILAIDADANTNLPEALGMMPNTTIADVLKEITVKPKAIPPTMAKAEYIEMRIEESMVEGEDVDLLVMGGPEGPGCYCYSNNLLKDLSERFSRNYPYVVLDNEAGLEHLSRRTTDQVDLLIVVSDSSIRAIRSAGRVKHTVELVDLRVKRMGLVVAQIEGEPDGPLQQAIEETGLELFGLIPVDPLVAQYDREGRPLLELPEDSLLVQASDRLLDRLLGLK